MPSLPPYRIGHGVHSISCRFKVGLEWLVSAYCSHYVDQRWGVGMATLHKGVSFGHKAEEVGLQSQGDQLWTQKKLVTSIKWVGA